MKCLLFIFRYSLIFATLYGATTLSETEAFCPCIYMNKKEKCKKNTDFSIFINDTNKKGIRVGRTRRIQRMNAYRNNPQDLTGIELESLQYKE